MNACATFARGKHLTFQRYERIYPLVALVFCHFPTPIPLFFCDCKNVASHFLCRFLFYFIGFCAFLCEDREGEFWECSCPPHFITCSKWWVLVRILWRNFDPHLHCPLNFGMSWIKKWQFFWSHHSFQNFDLSKPLWADIHFKCSIVGGVKGTNLITLLINYLKDISIYGCTYHGGQSAGSLLLLKVCDCFSTSSKCDNLLN